jgi:hypothetical protein
MCPKSFSTLVSEKVLLQTQFPSGRWPGTKKLLTPTFSGMLGCGPKRTTLCAEASIMYPRARFFWNQPTSFPKISHASSVSCPPSSPKLFAALVIVQGVLACLTCERCSKKSTTPLPPVAIWGAGLPLSVPNRSSAFNPQTKSRLAYKRPGAIGHAHPKGGPRGLDRP